MKKQGRNSAARCRLALFWRSSIVGSVAATAAATATVSLGLGVLGAEKAHADSGLMVCQRDGLFMCGFQERTLDGNTYADEVVYTVDVRYDCPVDFYLALRTDTQSLDIPWQNQGVSRYELSGFQSLRIMDTDPA